MLKDWLQSWERPVKMVCLLYNLEHCDTDRGYGDVVTKVIMASVSMMMKKVMIIVNMEVILILIW